MISIPVWLHLSGIYIGAGIMSRNLVSIQLRLVLVILIWNLDTLLQLQGCRVGSDGLDVVSRLDLTIIWAIILWVCLRAADGDSSVRVSPL